MHHTMREVWVVANMTIKTPFPATLCNLIQNTIINNAISCEKDDYSFFISAPLKRGGKREDKCHIVSSWFLRCLDAKVQKEPKSATQ